MTGLGDWLTPQWFSTAALPFSALGTTDSIRDPYTGVPQGMESAIVLNFCWCKCSYHDTEPVKAECWWLAPTGCWLGLCAGCCADWRQRAITEPDLAPVQLTGQRPR